jgi:hypothetical protein
LESVLGVVGMLQNAPADAQHHWSVSVHQGSERRFFAVVNEALEQLLVCGAAARQAVQIAEDARH